ncbi:unnamed protein product [Symbiodinium pilosum]|uniref:Protein kinase domain-containing protein n=1 Tax=Symbiodinium pilosum TaxID=2952 RepID=A0A812NI14_SYMPI|nr:unnamed protein product [Symbiodinium pilosum]
MELMEGSLAEAMSMWGPNHLVGSVAHLQVIRFVSASLLHTLARLNYGTSKSLVHRDVKPDNIMIDSLGAIRLGDFGISKVVEKVQEYSRASTGGPEAFASPEAMEDNIQAHRTSDLYSLGMVMLAMMLVKANGAGIPRDWQSQKMKLEDSVPQDWPPHISHAFRCLMKALLERSPKRRGFNERIPKNMTPHRIVLAHPFFWSSQKGLRFLVTLGTYRMNSRDTDIAADLGVFRNLRSEVHSAIEHALPEGKASWFDIVQDLEQTGKHETADYWKQEPFGLLKFIRNKYIHLNDSDMSVEVRTKLSQHVFQHRFPQLVARSWEALLDSIDIIQNYVQHAQLYEFFERPVEVEWFRSM